MKSFLEVVTYDEQEHFRGVEIALKIGADSLIETIKIAAKLANTR